MTPKQERFVQEYLIDLNATQAAIRAGYSEKTAGQIGEQNLKKLEISRAIERAQDKRAERLEVTQEMVLAGLYNEATATGEGSTHGARVSAWGLLGKHIGMFVERQETGKPGEFASLSPEQRKARVLELLGKTRKAG